MSYFRSLKYDTRSTKENKQIEEVLVAKIAKWKYSLSELTTQVPDAILKAVTPICDNVVNVARGIREQTLRQLMPNLSDKEVKESLKKNEQKLTPKFNTFLILSKDIEPDVKSNIIAWKDIYGLHKPTKEVVQIEDVEKDDEEINIDEIDERDNVDGDDEEDQETSGDLLEIQSIEDFDPKR